MIDLTDILTALQTAETRFVRVLWCDNANVIRAKAIHIEALAHHAHGVGISAAQQALPVMMDSPAANSGLGPVGEIWLMPDWTTLQQLPYALGHARAIGNMMQAGQPWAVCPRGFLQRMIAAADEQGIAIKAVFENEFYLLQPTQIAAQSSPQPSDRTVFASTLAMDLQQPVIDAIADALMAQGLAVEQYYPESGPGQHEISVRYAPALLAADQQIVFRETVRAIAQRHGLTASFLPKIFPEAAGSGCHIHFSLWAAEENITGDPSDAQALSETTRQFTAGLLYHLPALMALTTPTPNSYRRLQPHCWSGAYRCWGLDNREAAIRVPTDPGSAAISHIELKTVDATANPYLALGAMIAAGLDGIQQKRTLLAPVDLDPGRLSDTEQQQRGIDRLPTSLAQALQCLAQDSTLLEALGPPLAKAYRAVRQAECDALSQMELAAEVNLLLRRY
ncbi:MAG: glutamine synthetase [Leptolyngbya sp. SIO4C1]|nr:glutamine synthetase [Leptolyngbya sp. SIO4C1]